MDTITTLFAIGCAAAGISLVCVGGTIRFKLQTMAARTSAAKMRTERDEAVTALLNEEIEGAHFRELANDALANIEGLQARLLETEAASGRWAAKYVKANMELRKIHAEREEAAARRAAHMRSIAIIGNRSPKRRKQAVA